jgi:hypothetical protein
MNRFAGQCVLLACAFGIAHDLVTAHVCVEYFTVHHPVLSGSPSPIVQALTWGVFATWWMGVIGAALLLAANRLGPWQTLRESDIFPRLAAWTALGWLLSMVVLVGFTRVVPLVVDGRNIEDFDYKCRLMAVAVTHQWSYAQATLVVVLAAIGTLRRRMRLVSLRIANN